MPCPLPYPTPYTPRAATDTVLYDIVQAELAPFLAAARAAEVALPPYVEAELRAFLRCGVLACGFGRARCEACGFDRLVPFSCKRRGVCASCGGRRDEARRAAVLAAQKHPIGDEHVQVRVEVERAAKALHKGLAGPQGGRIAARRCERCKE